MFHMKHNVGSLPVRHATATRRIDHSMTDLAQNRPGLTGRGPSFEAALEHLVASAIDKIAPRLDAPADHSVRYRAEAETREALVGACLNAIMAQIDAFTTAPAGVSVDGVRAIEGGFRAWGTLLLDPEKAAPKQRVRMASHAIISGDAPTFEISIEIDFD